MKPAPFRYFAPKTVGEAHALLAEFGDQSRILAGGQSLVPLMNFRIAQPQVLVSINHCPDLNYMRSTPSTLVIGAAVRQGAAKDAVRASCPLLAQALAHVGCASSRNRGTVCGSLAHADPLAELPAVAVALDAQFVLTGAAGKRTVGAQEFFVAELTTSIEPGELLEEVHFPISPPKARCAFVEVGNRKHGFAIAGIAAQIELDGDRCIGAWLAGMGFGPAPTRFSACEQMLTGVRLSSSLLREVGEAACAMVDPATDIHADAWYRKKLAGVLLHRALNQATASEKQARGASR